MDGARMLVQCGSVRAWLFAKGLDIQRKDNGFRDNLVVSKCTFLGIFLVLHLCNL